MLEFWRIKIYISLKQKYFLVFLNCVLKYQNLHISQTNISGNITNTSFWRIKIYISLKLSWYSSINCYSFEESKFTYLSNDVSSIKWLHTVLKNQNLHISQTGITAKGNVILFWRIKIYISLKQTCKLKSHSRVLKNQNLHISQTHSTIAFTRFLFWRIKIYISLKQWQTIFCNSYCFEESKFTYLSNNFEGLTMVRTVLKNQNLHISQTSIWI